ncbi:hypothetical protein PoB_006215100 [Plakobranchus ocellatus]|uniref:Uncharacterized protein n=1 Tax=Plakobranchus ocellatus TaxID=259542 RepID=A0AAV4CUW0_9GAST|nr:hypothetical protein PoB_006215100 [Plakobranchus ocellatus]
MIKVAELSSCRTDKNINDFEEVNQIYERETVYTVQLCTDMCLWHLMAASDVLGRTIVSVYPNKGPACHHKLLDRTLKPSKFVSPDAILVMWSSCREIPNPDYWVANHISLLLPLSQPATIEIE